MEQQNPALSAQSKSGAAPSPEAGSGVEEPAVRQPFFSQVLAELGRVVWPSRQQLFSESVSVILMVAMSAVAVAASNRLFSWISNRVFLG
ncbi:MAG: preprotein translocase subunit SecE [Synechococcus sp. SB0665_bin_28]|nr:preprotein translocase subunit SecE [Synechococcus sp. SB0665_bin_28]